MATPCTVSGLLHDGVAELVVSGDVDLVALPEIRERVTRYLSDSACAAIVLDLSGATFIDSSGLGELITSKQRATDAGRTLRVAGAQGRVAEIIELTGLTAHLS